MRKSMYSVGPECCSYDMQDLMQALIDVPKEVMFQEIVFNNISTVSKKSRIANFLMCWWSCNFVVWQWLGEVSGRKQLRDFIQGLDNLVLISRLSVQAFPF